MAIYRVSVRGDALRILLDDKEMVCGFLKNEYVRCASAIGAEVIAKDRVRQALRRNSAVNPEDSRRAGLRIEEAEGGYGLSDLFRNEGFVFYPHGEEPEDP